MERYGSSSGKYALQCPSKLLQIPRLICKQNQFGHHRAVPVVFPHYTAEQDPERFRRRGSSSQLDVTPTPARSTGDFSRDRLTDLQPLWCTASTRTIRVICQARSCADGRRQPLPNRCQRGAGGGHGLHRFLPASSVRHARINWRRKKRLA